jgi:hypothetical protein
VKWRHGDGWWLDLLFVGRTCKITPKHSRNILLLTMYIGDTPLIVDAIFLVNDDGHDERRPSSPDGAGTATGSLLSPKTSWTLVSKGGERGGRQVRLASGDRRGNTSFLSHLIHIPVLDCPRAGQESSASHRPAGRKTDPLRLLAPLDARRGPGRYLSRSLARCICHSIRSDTERGQSIWRMPTKQQSKGKRRV